MRVRVRGGEKMGKKSVCEDGFGFFELGAQKSFTKLVPTMVVVPMQAIGCQNPLNQP